MGIRGSVVAIAFASALAVAGVARAQALSKPAEFYFEPDANTVRPVVAVRDSGDAAVERLLKTIKRDPRAVDARAQLAHIAMQGGRPELGRELYDAALVQLDTSSSLWRAVVWNYGWDLFRSGDAGGALARWQALLTTRGTTASWIPPTLALALWTVGRRDEAVQWYAAAVRTEPQLWRSAARHAELLPDWRDSERATLAEVQQAWAADPPAWP